MTTPDLSLTPVEPTAAPPSRGELPEPLRHGYKIPSLKLDGTTLGPPDMVAEYLNASGDVAFVVCRWNESEQRRKHFAPLVSVDGKLRWRGYPAPRPIYNLPALTGAPTAPVLIVEGEKTAIAAAAYLPDGWIVTTWAGGAGAVKQNDWSVLAEHRCVIWPDNDTAGREAAGVLTGILTKLRIPNAVVHLPSSLPEGWDLADPLPGEAKPDGVRRILLRTLETCSLPQAEVVAYTNGHANGHVIEHAPESEIIPPSITVPDGTVGAYVALGTDPGNETYYFLSTESKRLIRLRRDKLSSSDAILSVHADYGWWCNRFLSGRTSKDGLEAFSSRESKHIGNSLRSSCHLKGVFNEGRIRSRGVFIEAGHIITHVGHEVWVDGHVTDPSSIISNYIYPLSEPLMKITGTRALTADEGRLIIGVAQGLRWDHPSFADLLVGLIATAPICGALKWRTHGIITGPKGAGKSWVLEEFVGRCLGDFAIKVLGETSAAGIRSQLRHERLPVTFDESETNSGERGASRMDQIVDLMRSASKATAAKVLKGSANHEGTSFSLHTVFILGCIGIPISKAADMTRTVVLTLKGAAADEDGERKSIAAHFQDLTERLERIPEDVAEKLLRRMSQLAPIVQANADTFRKVIAEKYADSRVGDQMGVLFAGRYNLEFDGIMPRARAEQYLAKIDWKLFTQSAGVREDLMLLSHMAADMVRCDAPQGLSLTRTLGELVGLACSIIGDPRLPAEDARANLQRYGLRAVMGAGDVPGFIMHSSHPYLDRLFAKSDYLKGYYEIIARNPSVKRSTAGGMGKSASMSIGHAGNKRSYIWIPADLICAADDGIE